MNSRERLLTALAHKEPDRIPFDLGGTLVSGINVHALRRLAAAFLACPENRRCWTA